MSYFFPSTMPRRRSPCDSFSDLPRPFSTGDIELSTEEMQLPPPSMMYSMLPAMVQSHIPRLSSLRRSVSELRRRPTHVRATSLDTLGAQTPPPQYSSRPSSRGDNLCTALDVSDSEAYPEDGVMSSSTTSPLLVGSDGESGIKWKFSNQGALRSSWIIVVSLTFARPYSSQASFPGIFLYNERCRRWAARVRASAICSFPNLPTTRLAERHDRRGEVEHLHSHAFRIIGYSTHGAKRRYSAFKRPARSARGRTTEARNLHHTQSTGI